VSYIILSDLHIGGNSKLDIFHSQDQLTTFLQSLANEQVSLIIAGDFIDFLAVEPFEIFTREAAKKKIQTIIDAPPNKVVWKAFQSFLSFNTGNTIDILLGNHDVELVFEEVQAALSRVMAAKNEGDRIRFYMDRLSHPGVSVGDVPIYIEHGFQYDPFNWYDREKLVLSASFNQNGKSFDLPIGSKLVYSVLNKLTPDHPFIPLLKPEGAVFWLMVALAPKEVLEQIGIAPGLAKDTIMKKLKIWRRGAQLGKDDADSADAILQTFELQLLQMLYDKNLDDATLKEVDEFLTNGTGEENASPAATFSYNPLLRGKLFFIKRALKSLRRQRDEFFDPAKGSDFKKALTRVQDLGAKVAIFGHSHGRKLREIPKKYSRGEKLLYVNTGTWADLLDFQPKVLANNKVLLNGLQNRQISPKLISTFARLEELPGGRGARVSLQEWCNGKVESVGLPQEILP
jgi:UDP-2,3-diacylglucosamine pyrophosphatase LpxH